MRTQPLDRSSIRLIILLFACIAFLIFGPPALSEWSHANYLTFLQNLDESDVVGVLVYHNLSAVGSPVLKLESSADQHAIQQLVKALNGVASASGTRDYIGEPPLHMKIELIDGEHIELSIPQRTSCGADIHLEFVTLKSGPFLVESRFTSWKEMRSWLIDQGLYKYLACNIQ